MNTTIVRLANAAKELRTWWYSLADLDREMDRAVSGGASATGISVTENSALGFVGVWNCITLLAQTVASVPLPVYRQLSPQGKERAPEHPLYRILHDEPNSEMNSFSLREALQSHVALWGNAFAEIEYARDGTVTGLWPLNPSSTKVMRKGGRLWYVIRLPNGQDTILPDWRVFHIPGFSFDGIVGYSPLQKAREAIALGMAAEQDAATLFRNGSRPDGILEHPQKLSDEAEDRLRKSWEETHKGLSNRNRIAILEEGLKYHTVGIPPEDAQLLETRKFQKTEIASFFHIPPHMVGDLERATFSNIEHQSIEFVVHTMRPWFIRWEQAIQQKLFLPSERGRYMARFVIDGLLRGDIESRYKAYSIGRQWGWLSANDVRELENMNPLPGEQGDIYLVPLNMVPAGQVSDSQRQMTRLLDAPVKLLETRSGNGAMQRKRVADSYKSVFHDAGQRIVEREANNVRRALKKHLAERSAVSFTEWLTDFYRDFPEYVQRQIRSAVQGLAEAIAPVAAEEVSAEYDKEKLEQFIEEYTEAFSMRYTQSNKGQLEALLAEALDEAKEPTEIVEQRVSEWEQREPGKVAMNETVQLSNAVALTTFGGAGITRLRWYALGSETCPLCQEMNGKVVGIQQPFLNASETLEAEGTSNLSVRRPTTHPPLHQGCVCQIIPERT